MSILQHALISMIAPFYNSERYLDRFLNSILAQTISNVQFILVNDGSTDNGEAIVGKYKTKLEEKFVEFVYLKKENAGAGSAVNTALKYVRGEYLCWADCDDMLLPQNIEKKYLFLEKYKDFGLVNCGARAISQDTGEIIEDLVIPKSQQHSNMFRSIISGIPVYPGVFMIRTKLLFEKIENREIYFNREVGQNYQLLLPVAYDNKCGFIDDILYLYYVREDSHSHNADYEKKYARTFARELLLKNVLVFVEENKRKKLLDEIHLNSTRERFDISFVSDDRVRNNEAYNDLRRYNYNLKDVIKHIIINCEILNKVYRRRKKD